MAVKPLHRVAAEIPRIGLCVRHEQKKKYCRPWSIDLHNHMMIFYVVGRNWEKRWPEPSAADLSSMGVTEERSGKPFQSRDVL